MARIKERDRAARVGLLCGVEFNSPNTA